MNINDIKPYSKNAKLHDDEQLLALAKIVREVGWRQNVLVNHKTGIIIAGHGRMLAWQKYKDQFDLPDIWITNDIGETVFGCLDKRPISEEQEIIYRLADNKLNESKWTMDIVIDELKMLDIEGVELTGFDSDILVDDDENDDVVPAEPEEPKTHLGEVWTLGDHRMVIGDATDPDVIKILIQDHKADCVLTDPPYNVNYEDGKGEKIMNDKMEDSEFDTFLVKVFQNYKDLMKEGAPMYCFHSTKTQDQFRKAIEEVGLEVKTQLIWNKPSATLGMNDYRSKHEPFYYAGFPGVKTQFYGDRTHTTIWDIQDNEDELVKWAKRQKTLERQGKTTIWTMKRDNVGKYVHPTQKPVELLGKALVNSTKKGDIVVDFFGGSGSTLIACEKYGRVCKTMELDCKFADVILTRFRDFTGKEPIRESDGMAWSELRGEYNESNNSGGSAKNDFAEDEDGVSEM